LSPSAAATFGATPSRADFDGFWINRFDLTMLLSGSGCDRDTLHVDPASFRALYALHRGEIEKALEDITEKYPTERRQFDTLTQIDVKHHYEWDEVMQACASIAAWNSVVFVFAHSDGDSLHLGESTILAEPFTKMIQKDRKRNTAELLILNCCVSAVGANERRSLLSSVAKRGFCGMIGTEAEIQNTDALRCGIRLMWELFARERTLGAAFNEMQREKALFPSNLLYTCFATRDFHLLGPIAHAEAA
jgi:hypothetical protein